jgi:sugar phosphate isomerase/epimerase
VVAIEGHAGNAIDRPEKALWMLEQVKSPWVGNLFDFSHYHLQGLELGETMRQLAGRTVVHHVKDSVGTPEKFRFLLPGDSREIDYHLYAKVLGEIDYRGTLLLEVSARIFNQPGYDGWRRRSIAGTTWLGFSPEARLNLSLDKVVPYQNEYFKPS